MAPSNGHTGSAEAPFSYAQAAKAKAQESTAPNGSAPKPAIPSRQSKESISTTSTNPTIESKMSWADDSADANTLVENGTPNGLSNEAEANVDAQKRSQAEQPSAGNATKVSSGIIDIAPQFSDINNNDMNNVERDSEPIALPRSMQDTDWRQRPKADTLTSDQVTEETSSMPKDDEGEQFEQKSLTEAPIPAVNVWAQRAQTRHPSLPAVLSQPAPTIDKDQLTASAHPSVSTSKIAVHQDAAHSADSTVSRETDKSQGRPAHSGTKATIEMRRDSVSKTRPSLIATRPRPSQPPSIGDNASWPTPLTAKDEERRKSTKSEKGDGQKGSDQGSKPHGKQWVQMDFTPSVKFETPMPLGSRRGARGGPRGARGSDTGGRAGFSNTAPPHAQGNDGRGRMSSVSIASESNSGRPPRRSSTLGDSMPPQNRTTQNILTRQRGFQSPSKETISPGAAANHRSASRSKTKEYITKADEMVGENEAENFTSSPSQISANRRRSVATQTESGVDETSVGRMHNPASVATHRKRSISNSHFWTDRRSEFAGRGREFGRTDRGRGRGGRGVFAHAFGPNHLQAGGSPATPYITSPMPSRSPVAHSYQIFQGSGHGMYGSSRSYSNELPYTQSSPGQPTTHLVASNLENVYSGNAGQTNATPYTPYWPQMLANGVCNQLNYYFSVDNLCKDTFLRKHMDSQGFVSLKLIADFSRMKQLSADFDFIRDSAAQSIEFELSSGSDGIVKIRKREGWDKFVLKIDERHPSAQNDGPSVPSQQALANHTQRLHSPPVFNPSYFNGSPYPTGNSVFGPPPQNAFPPFSPMSVATASPLNGLAHSPNNRHSDPWSAPNSAYLHEEQRSSGSAGPETSNSPKNEDDAFPNEKIGELRIFSRFLSWCATATSDEQALRSKSPRKSQGQPEANLNGHTGQSPDGVASHTSSPQRKSSLHRSSDTSTPTFFLKGENAPGSTPPEVNEPYRELRARALEARANSVDGRGLNDMDMLYCFWSDFLLSNFNSDMYGEFHQLALEDLHSGLPTVGPNSLIKYYSDALSKMQPIRQRLAQDYVRLVKQEVSRDNQSAFKQLRASLRNGALDMKNRKIITDLVDADLRAELER